MNIGSSNENFNKKTLINSTLSKQYLTSIILNKKYISGIIIGTLIVTISMFSSCNEKVKDKIAAVVDRSSMPSLRATDISTVISDSGITRYRISTPKWDMYDKTRQPYQEFPEGIHLEKFDLNLKVDANIHSKYAKYYEYDQIWELKGSVKATNLLGEIFETEQLFWNQKTRKIYSTCEIKITSQVKLIIIYVYIIYKIKNYEGL